MISPEQVKQNRRKNSTHEATDGVAVIERKIEKTTKKKTKVVVCETTIIQESLKIMPT